MSYLNRFRQFQLETLLFGLLNIIFWSPSVFAKIIDFATLSRQIRGGGDSNIFEQTVLSIQPGDVLVMSDGNRFTIEKKLGQGHQHCVFAFRESMDWALRIPYQWATRLSTLDTIEGYAVLKETSLRTVAIHPLSNWEYVLAERVKSDYYTVSDFLFGRKLGSMHPIESFEPSAKSTKHNQKLQIMLHKATKISEMELQQMEEALVKFGGSLGEFLQIHDLKDNQIVYDRQDQEWILIDWLYLIERYSPEHDGLFTSYRELVFDTFKRNNRFLYSLPGLVLPADVYDRWRRVAARMRGALLAHRLRMRGNVNCERTFTLL